MSSGRPQYWLGRCGTRLCRSCLRTASHWRKCATRPTTSWPLGPCRPGRSGERCTSVADHYFSAEPGSADVRRTVEARIWGREYTFTTATGVFSRDRLDIGTAVLLREVDPPAQPGTFLDLGTGYGPIACALAVESPEAEVWAVDVNTRALELTAENAGR